MPVIDRSLSDCRYTQEAGASPKEVFGFKTRWSGWWYTADGVALMRERRWKDRSEVAWRADADGARQMLLLRIHMPAIDRSLSYMPAIDRSLSLLAGTRVKLWERMYQDRYAR